jgi:hypothetical protein
MTKPMRSDQQNSPNFHREKEMPPAFASGSETTNNAEYDSLARLRVKPFVVLVRQPWLNLRAFWLWLGRLGWLRTQADRFTMRLALY